MEREPRLNGILMIDKPKGFTSFDVVAKLRGMLHERRIGHGGTLDPMATGVLPVFIGGATKAADMAAAQDKAYTAAFALGYATDTQDSTGTETARSEKRASPDEVRQAVEAMRGRQQQVPPMYSAIKVDGRRLYELARRGVEVERKPREITVHSAKLVDFDEQKQTGVLRVRCSKGTYVRTLVHDMGERLGTHAVMTALRRTQSGRFDLSECHTLEEVQWAADHGAVERIMLDTDSLFLDYPAVTIDEYGYRRACNGAFIPAEHVRHMPQQAGTLCRVYYEETFWMLGRVKPLERGGLALFYEKRFR